MNYQKSVKFLLIHQHPFSLFLCVLISQLLFFTLTVTSCDKLCNIILAFTQPHLWVLVRYHL